MKVAKYFPIMFTLLIIFLIIVMIYLSQKYLFDENGSIVIVLIIVAISSLISGFLSWAILEKKNWSLIISAIIIGAIISYNGTVTFYLHQKFSKIESFLNSYNNSLAKANREIKNLNIRLYPITKKIFTDKIKNYDEILSNIYLNKQIIIDKDDILNIWSTLINNSKHKFYATNLVPPKEWKYVSPDKFGMPAQLNAINIRHVKVKRINFFDEKYENHKKGMCALYKTQKQNGIPSSLASIDWIYGNPTFNSFIKQLGTADVVLVDDEILLLTIIDRRNYEMEYSILCFDEHRIEIAKKFFEKLYEHYPPTLSFTKKDSINCEW